MKNGKKRAVCLLIALVMAVASLAWAEDAAIGAGVVCGNADEVIEEQGEFLLGAPEGEDISSNEASPMELGPDGLLIAYDDVPEETDAIALSKNGATNGPAFEDTAELDGVAVTVRAPAGAFPDGAELSVAAVPVNDMQDAADAVEEARGDGHNVAASYSFDIRVLYEGAEIEPAPGYAVEVTFAVAEAADANLEASVYHVTDEGGEVTAEKLDVDVDADTETVTTQTESFSIYTVEFTYKDLTYVLQGGTSALLSEILTAVGLSGTPSSVSVSNEALFTVTGEGEARVVESLGPFNSVEYLDVVIDNQTFRITVTDAQEIEYINEGGTVSSVSNYTALTSQTVWNDGTYVATGDVTISDRVRVSGTVSLILCDGATLTVGKGINVGGNNYLVYHAQVMQFANV